MLRWLLPLAFIGPIFISGGRQDTGTPPPDTFVTLEDSATFGSGGSVFDYTTQIVPKVYHGPPPENSSYTTTTTMPDSCSSDDTTWEALKEYLDGDGTGDAADSTVIVLPASCRIKAFLAGGYGDVADLTIANKYDDVKLYCADEDTCGIEINLDSVPDNTVNNRATAIQVGASGIVSTGVSEAIDASAYTWGSKMLQSSTSIDVSTSAAWGPGDIVEISLARIQGYGSNTPDWMTRLTCVDGPTAGTSDRFGTDCSELTGDNQFQIADVPPLNLNPNAYYWGVNSGSSFTPHSSEGGAGSGTYADTSGHTITQVERMGSGRGGIGTGTDQVPENFWFDGVSFTVADNVLGTRYLIGANWYGGGNYRGNLERTVGRVSAFTYGNRGNGWRVSHVSMHSMNWPGTGANVKCIGKILAINATDPVTVDVQSLSSTECANDSGGDDPDWNEPEVMFSWDLADSRLAGKRFRVTATNIGGSPNRERVTLTGFNASSLSPALDTTVAGYAGNIDRYGGASFYANDSTSYFQVINNWYKNTAQHFIMQGCAGCVYAANFVTSLADEAEGGRGPFFHGNRGESGLTADHNDQNQAFIIQDSGNGEPVGHGEGSNHAFCFNRKRTSPTLTWPDGTATGSNYAADVLISLLQTGQNGASNEDWSYLLNASQTSMWQGVIDDCDNNDTDDGSSACVEPGTTWAPAVYRNRCASCNQDSNWDTALNSPETSGDILGTESGDSSAARPSAWDSEVDDSPDSCFFTAVPEFWCDEAVAMGEMGGYHDDFGGTLGKLPAQIRYEGTTCTLP